MVLYKNHYQIYKPLTDCNKKCFGLLDRNKCHQLNSTGHDALRLYTHIPWAIQRSVRQTYPATSRNAPLNPKSLQQHIFVLSTMKTAEQRIYLQTLYGFLAFKHTQLASWRQFESKTTILSLQRAPRPPWVPGRDRSETSHESGRTSLAICCPGGDLSSFVLFIGSQHS